MDQVNILDYQWAKPTSSQSNLHNLPATASSSYAVFQEEFCIYILFVMPVPWPILIIKPDSP
jgi:hypothetical protein